MAIVWTEAFNQQSVERSDGPVIDFGAYDTVDSNYNTTFEIVGGADAHMMEFVPYRNSLRVRAEYLQNYKGYETPLSNDNLLEVKLKAHHEWYNWNTNSWVVTEGEQLYTVRVTDIGPYVFERLYPSEGLIAEGSVGGAAVREYFPANPITFDAKQFSDGTGPATLTLAAGSSGRYYLEKGANDVYALKVTPGVLIDYDTMAGTNDGLEALTINISDGTTTVQRTFSVRINNEAPSAVTDTNGPSGANVAEHLANGTAIGITAHATDPGGGTIAYSFNDNYNGATYGGGARFGLAINASTGVITVADSKKLDFEQTQNGSVLLAINATDATGAATTSIVTLNLQDRNDAPDFLRYAQTGFSLSTSEPGTLEREQAYRENSTDVVGTVRAWDQDVLPAADTLSYTLSGADAALFAIDSGTGEIRFKASPNFEARADSDHDNVYRFNVVAADGTTSTSQAVTVALADVNEAPVIAGGATKTLSFVEGTSSSTILYHLSATDPEAGSTLTYGLVGSYDAFSFDMDASGNLRFRYPPNYDFPDDQGQNHAYDITAYAYDGTTTTTQAIKVSVTEAPENRAPTIVSNGAGASAAVNVKENGKTVTTVAAADADPGTSLTYSLVGGADLSRFTIDAHSGALAFKTAPDFETRTDANKDGIYQVTVGVSDGTISDTQSLSVKVLDVAGITKSGSSGPDTLTGTIESDKLSGKGSNDTIKGVGGLDILTGGTGADKLYGGVDGVRDTFVFAKGDSGSIKQSASTWDRVFDFRSGIDKIDLSAIDADAFLSGSQDLRFVTKFVKAVAKDRVADGQYRLVDDGASYKVEIDYNGDTTADMVIRVMNVASLKAGTSGDFLL